VVLVRTGVLVESIASIIRMKEISEIANSFHPDDGDDTFL
jgi:hypothetical protein